MKYFRQADSLFICLFYRLQVLVLLELDELDELLLELEELLELDELLLDCDVDDVVCVVCVTPT